MQAHAFRRGFPNVMTMLYLLDSSAVLNDFSFQFKEEHSYITTPLALDEFLDLRSRHLAENALQNGLLKIKEPSNESIELIKKAVAEKGFSRLSKTDISLLGLAIDLKEQKKKFKLVSDDYSIQNFCKLLKLPFESVIRGRIKETIAFKLKCPACGKTVKKGQKAQKCSVCGSRLVRVRARRRNKLRHDAAVEEALKLLEKGFKMGKLKFKSRAELHER